MANFAELNEDNKVIRVLVVNNWDINDMENNYSKETEDNGVRFLKQMFGENTKWIQTSYNNNFRVRYASIGDTYDENLDIFVKPKPYSSWILNQSTYEWEPPLPKPEDGNLYFWNENIQDWELMILEP